MQIFSFFGCYVREVRKQCVDCAHKTTYAKGYFYHLLITKRNISAIGSKKSVSYTFSLADPTNPTIILVYLIALRDCYENRIYWPRTNGLAYGRTSAACRSHLICLRHLTHLARRLGEGLWRPRSRIDCRSGHTCRARDDLLTRRCGALRRLGTRPTHPGTRRHLG
jgi:hypothetical protein